MGLRPGLDWIISLISCMQSEHLFTGMLVKVWRRVNSLRLVRTWPPLRKTMKRLPLTAPLEKMKKLNIKGEIKCSNRTVTAEVEYENNLQNNNERIPMASQSFILILQN